MNVLVLYMYMWIRTANVSGGAPIQSAWPSSNTDWLAGWLASAVFHLALEVAVVQQTC